MKSTQRATKAIHRRVANEAAAVAGTFADREASKEEKDFVWRCYSDPKFFMENFLWVQDIEGGRLVPFHLNQSQLHVLDRITAQLEAGVPARVLVLKARRQGITTLGEGLGYWMTSTHPHTNGMVLAHDHDTAKEIHRICKNFYAYDEREKLGLRPDIEQSNERALRFANADKKTKQHDQGLQSSMLVETADGKDAGRGLTLQFVHGSEVGFWTRAEVMAGLEIALSKAPGTIGILESTANGVGNLFHDMWEQAVAGKSGWDPIFLPWTWDARCSKKLTERQRMEWDWETREERDYAELHKITLEQAAWKRLVMASPAMFQPGRSRTQVFMQEYPATPEEAFITSGSHFFLMGPLKGLRESERGIREPAWTGEIKSKQNLGTRTPNDRTPLVPVLETPGFGPLDIWEPPAKNEDYVIGADVAEGLEHGDFSVAFVLRRSTLSVVARWRGHCDADEFGHICALLGTHYNQALVGIEHNGPGIAANLALRKIHYQRIWYDRAVANPNEPMADRVGWKTTEATRMMMLAALEAEVREGSITIPSREWFLEAERFVYATNESGRAARPQAAAGKHDDEVMALAIAVQMHLKGGAIRRRAPIQLPANDPMTPANQPMAMPNIEAPQVAQVISKKNKRTIDPYGEW